MQTEARIQQECFLWFHNNHPHLRGLLFQVNNNSNDKVKGAIQKALGRVAGVSDMIFLSPKNGAVMLEFKTPTGKQSKNQKIWEKKVKEFNYSYYLVNSLELFKTIIISQL